MIEVKNVTKILSQKKILDDVSMMVEKGTICGLVGRNGSGKTVLMKCICGFYTPEQGEIKLRGKSMESEKNAVGNMGIIIENPGFLESESARKNLCYLAKLKGLIGEKEVDEALRMVGLDPKEKKAVRKYSMGMRQRLGIAQAIMENQDIILLDEPMNGLDEQGIGEMRKVFLSLKKEGKTILLASHNEEDIHILCDKVYRMDGGKLS